MPTASQPAALKEGGRRAEQVGDSRAFVHQVQEVQGDFTFVLHPPLIALTSKP